MQLRAFNNYKIVNINGQVVKKKSPWPKILVSLMVTGIIIFALYSVKPNVDGLSSYGAKLKTFFDFAPIRVGLSEISIGDTLLDALNLLIKTILFSVLGTIIGIFCAVPLAFLSSRNITKKWYIYTPFRFLMSLIRSIPPLIIAFLMFQLFSQSLSATVALAIFVTSLMTKWIFEELDSIDLTAFDSLQALGNQKSRAITVAIFPYLMRSIVSYGIYAFEMVIRFATILGVVGIATIGSLLSDTYRAPKRWGHMSIVLMVLIVTILVIEILSMLFREYIINWKPKQIKLNKKRDLNYQIAQTATSASKFWIVKLTLMIALMIGVVVAIVNVDWHLASEQKLAGFKSGMHDFFRPEWSFISDFGTGVNAIELAVEAILVACVAAFLGLIISLILGLLAAKAVLGKYFSWIFKMIIITIRSVPAFVYAITFIYLSPEPKIIFAGTLALGVHSVGMLGKLTYEKLDNIDLESRLALETMGSTRWQSTRWALLKEAMPTILSNAIYRIEINFKSTVEIGAVGASIFGFQISAYAADATKFSWLAPYVIVTMVVILILEQISNLLRKKLMTGMFFSKNNFLTKKINFRKKVMSLVYEQVFNLKLATNAQEINFNNYVGKAATTKNNKMIVKNKRKQINHEIKTHSWQQVLNKYS